MADLAIELGTTGILVLNEGSIQALGATPRRMLR
jgi:hypothetical protein